jgi:hypothetical protein
MTIRMDELFDRIKNLKEFEVTLEMPDDFVFRGVVPYDMHIDDRTVRVKILALTYQEAEDRVFEYFNK